MRIAAQNSDRIAAAPLRLPPFARGLSAETPQDHGLVAAGAALAALDALQRSEAAFLGVWRQRLALRASAATARLLRLRAAEADLRDAWLLRRPDVDPGPAGRVHGLFVELTSETPDCDAVLVRAAAEFGLPRPSHMPDAAAGPLAAAMAIAAALAPPGAPPQAEALARLAADRWLALDLGWPRVLPLFSMQSFDPALRLGEEGRRLRPQDAEWRALAPLALARAASDALDLAADLARRAEMLVQCAPALRAKASHRVVSRLLQKDALTAAEQIEGLSERGLRRLFDRLVGLGAVRELSGRPTFRIYGL